MGTNARKRFVEYTLKVIVRRNMHASQNMGPTIHFSHGQVITYGHGNGREGYSLPVYVTINSDRPILQFPSLHDLLTSRTKVEATYLVHFDILADEHSHCVLHALGQSRFSSLEGWLSESLFTVQSSSVQRTTSSTGASRYICIQAFSDQTCVEQITSYLKTFKANSAQYKDGVSTYTLRVYKFFGSTC